MPNSEERQYQSAVIQTAKALGWRVYHTHDSRRSEAGFPDLCMVRNGRIVFAELKSTGGKITPAQSMWICDLGDAVEVHADVYWPKDYDDLIAELQREVEIDA